MVNTQLFDYIKQQLAQGLSKETIQQNLSTTGGWSISDINEAFSVLNINQPTTSSSPIPNAIPSAPVKYAGFWIRFVAITVDSLIVSFIAGIIEFPLTLTRFFSAFNSQGNLSIQNLSHPSWVYQLATTLVSVCIGWTYYVWLTHSKGATLGKMLVGIQVKSDNLGRLSFLRVLRRETIGKFVSGIILGIGYIIAGVTQKKQALHDMFAHSVVVYKDPSKPHTVGIVIGVIIVTILPVLTIVALVSVFLVSFNVARQKANDTRVTSVIQQMRTEAEVYYGKNNSYSTTRSCASGMFVEDQTFATITAQIQNKNILNCYAEGSNYAISAPLSSTTQNYCVDNTGYSGDAVAMDNNGIAKCQTVSSSNNQTQGVPSTQTASTGAYNFTLPSGWIIAQNGPQGMQALNQSRGYLLSITATAIPSVYGSVTSVDQVVSTDQLKASLIKKYPNANTKSVSVETIGGKKAYVMNYDISSSDLTGIQNQSQSKQMSITEYTTIDNGNVYTIAFISALSDEVTASIDLQTIIDSFKFNN